MTAVRRYGSVPAACLLALVLLAACDANGPDRGDDLVEGIDFDRLFSPPTAAELSTVASEWGAREVGAEDVETLVETGLISGGWESTVRVLRHRVGKTVHVGAVLVPAAAPARPRPVLLYLHGSDEGVSIDSEVAPLLAASPELRDEFVVVVPSFRGEEVRLAGASYRSDGPPSPWDRDVDDTLALLDVAIKTVPSADPTRVVALGFSRGATVGLLAAIRDDRIDAVIDFFGPTDFMGSFAREVLRESLMGTDLDLPGLDYLVRTVADPLAAGELTMEKARLALIRRSPVYFAARLPVVQIHHGRADDVVPVDESKALEVALSRYGLAEGDLIVYDGGVHHPLSLAGALERVTAFLIRITEREPV